MEDVSHVDMRLCAYKSSKLYPEETAKSYSLIRKYPVKMVMVMIFTLFYSFFRTRSHFSFRRVSLFWLTWLWLWLWPVSVVT